MQNRTLFNIATDLETVQIKSECTGAILVEAMNYLEHTNDYSRFQYCAKRIFNLLFAVSILLTEEEKELDALSKELYEKDGVKHGRVDTNGDDLKDGEAVQG